MNIQGILEIRAASWLDRNSRRELSNSLIETFAKVLAREALAAQRLELALNEELARISGGTESQDDRDYVLFLRRAEQYDAEAQAASRRIARMTFDPGTRSGCEMLDRAIKAWDEYAVRDHKGAIPTQRDQMRVVLEAALNE